MRILYFGRLSDIAGGLSEDLRLPPGICDSSALRSWLDAARGFDGALRHRSVRTAVNNMIVPDPHPVSDTDEVAFMPPVGGG